MYLQPENQSEMTPSREADVMFRFLSDIGIETEFRAIEEDTFLPGILIQSGRLIIDPDKLKYPGDVLHEAGHLAMVPKADRASLQGNVEPGPPSQSLELGAILWSYAAAVHLGLDPAFVFHEAGYKGQSKWFIEQFQSGTYIGLPLLQWMGLTLDPQQASEKQVDPFPCMVKWLRD